MNKILTVTKLFLKNKNDVIYAACSRIDSFKLNT